MATINATLSAEDIKAILAQYAANRFGVDAESVEVEISIDDDPRDWNGKPKGKPELLGANITVIDR